MTESKNSANDTNVFTQLDENIRFLSQVQGDAIYIHKDGKIIIVNDALCKLYGYSREELIGKDIKELVPKSEHETLRANLSSEKDDTIHSYISKKDKTTVPVEINIRNIVVGNSQLRMVGLRDRSKEIEHQALLKRTEENLQLAISAANLGIFDFNPTNGEFHWDARMDEIFGYDANNSENRREFYFSTLHPLDKAEVTQQFEQVLAEQQEDKTFDNSYRIIYKNGSIRHIQSIGSFVRNSENEIIRIIGTCKDITLEENLKEAESILAKRNELILETAFDGFILADIKGNILEVNRSYVELIGYNKEELLQMSIHDLEKGNPPDEFTLLIDDTLANGSATFERTHKHKQGHEINLHINLSVLENNREKYMVALLRDISLQKKAEQERQESEKKFKSIFAHTQVGVALVDSEGKPFLINDALEKMFGYSKEELASMPFPSFTHPEDIDKDVALYRKLLNQEIDSYSMDKRYIHKEGKTIWGLLTVSAVRDKEGSIQYAVGMVTDISEQKKAEIGLSESERKFKSIFDYSIVGIALVHKDGKPFLVNDALADILGYTKEEIISGDFTIFTHPADIQKDFSMYQKLQAGEIDTYNLEKRFIHKDGRTVWGLLTVSTIRDKDGQVQHAVGMVTDISEQKQAELALEKSEKRFEQIVQEQTEFVVRWKTGGIILFANEAYCRFRGKRMDELIGKSFFQWLSPEKIRSLENNLKKLTEQNPITLKVNDEEDNEGNRKWVEWSNRVFFDEEGKIYEIQAIGRDVTARKRAEKQLIASEVRYRSLFEKAQDAIYIADLETFELIDCNLKAVEMFGYESKEHLLRHCMAKLSPENQSEGLSSADKFLEVLEELRQSGYYFTQWKHLRKDKKTFDSEASLSLIEIGNKKYLQSSVRDISERIAAEKRLSSAYLEVERLKKQLEQENIYLQQEIQVSNNFENIVFASKQFRELLQKVEQVAPVDATVLILGETGTGKELIARAVHNLSNRKHKTLVKVSCAALPRELIESELFGHEKGAFTGAIKQKIGRFELANGGTLFLDEIGELPVDLQSKLLRVIQEGEFERIGGTETLNVDVRIIAATNRDLIAAIQSGTFREDLYYRLHVFPIEIPPLRDRREDIFPLTTFFLKKYSKKFTKDINPLSISTIHLLENYHWPGNARELENLCERALILSQNGHIPFAQLLGLPNEEPQVHENLTALKAIERKHILKILVLCNWKINGPGGAAEKLELTPSTVRDRMKKLNILRPK